MPQLDVSTFASQIFWLIATFLSLWFCMSFFIVPKIAAILEERRRKIDDYVTKAESINKKALNTLEKYEEAILKAKDEAEEKVCREKEKLQAEAEIKKAEINQTLSEEIIRNEKEMQVERAKTLQAVDKVSLEIADLILNKFGVEFKSEDKDKTFVGH